jgi:hypothetical protein
MLDIKKQIYKRIKGAFKTTKGEEGTDEEINKMIILQIKDTTPFSSKNTYNPRKEDCEFCGNKHNLQNDVCDIITKQYKKDGNSLEAATNITLNDLYK